MGEKTAPGYGADPLSLTHTWRPHFAKSREEGQDEPRQPDRGPAHRHHRNHRHLCRPRLVLTEVNTSDAAGASQRHARYTRSPPALSLLPVCSLALCLPPLPASPPLYPLFLLRARRAGLWGKCVRARVRACVRMLESVGVCVCAWRVACLLPPCLSPSRSPPPPPSPPPALC